MTSKLFKNATIDIDKIKIKTRGRKDLGDLTELKQSLQKSGLINPILIDSNNLLIAGERRLTVAKKLGWNQIDVRISPEINRDNLLLLEMMENVARKDFTWSEELELKKALHEYWSDLAVQENQKWGFRETAKKLNVSLGGLSTDLVLAIAIKTFPKLTEYETKTKAKAAYKKMGEQAQAIQAANNLSPEEKINLKNMMSGKLKSVQDKKGKSKLLCSQHEDSVPVTETKTNGSTIEHQELKSKNKKYEVAYIITKYNKFLNDIPDNQVGLIELDPPYAIDFNTNYGQVSNIKSKATDWTVEKLFNFYTSTLPILYNKLLDNSFILCWTGIEHWIKINQLAEQAGFKVQQKPGVWVKPGGSCNSPKTTMISSYETFLLFRKGNATFNTPSFPSVIHFDPAPATQRIHQWEKPLDMYRYFCSALGRPGSLFLSLFAGSGNALIAATYERMIAMGCDESQKYVYEFYNRFNKLFN